MSRRFSALHQYEPYFIAGVLGAHGAGESSGFRLRDAVFFANLVSNWTECFLPARVLGVTGIQMSRFLNEMVGEGYTRRAKGGGCPRFRLNRFGILALVKRLSTPRAADFEGFLFSYFFLRSYVTRLKKLVSEKQELLTSAYLQELETLCDTDSMWLTQRRFLQEQLRKLDQRILAARETARICAERSAADAQVQAEIAGKYTYQLSNERPLAELLSKFSVLDRIWELQEGNALRLSLLWEPSREVLLNRLAVLERLPHGV